MDELKYSYIYSVLISTLKGESYKGQELKTIDFGDFILRKSITENNKLCWIVEKKGEVEEDAKLD